MRIKAFLGSFATLGAVLLTAGIALAGQDYEVKGTKGEITVVAKGHYHVNKDYPWKVIAGGKTISDKSKFSFTETVAKVSGLPAGTVHLKGAVCEGTDKCVPFEQDVTVN